MTKNLCSSHFRVLVIFSTSRNAQRIISWGFPLLVCEVYDSILILMCRSGAQNRKCSLPVWGAETDDNDTELSSLFKSSMSLAREKKLSVVKGWSFVLMEQSHRLTRQLVSNLVFKSCFFSFISTPFFCWFKSA